VERPMAMSQDPFDTFLEVPGESLQGLDSTPDGAVIPLLPEPQSSPLIAIIPKVLQIILQNVHSGQPLIGREQLVEPDAFRALLDVFPVSQQEPARALNDFASGLVVPEPISFVYANAVDHLPTVLRDDVEQILHDLDPWALVPNFLLVGGVHVDRHCTEPTPTLRSQFLKKRPDVLTTPAPTHPKDALGRWVYNHRGVAMSLLNGELIHGDDFDTAEIDWSKGFLQVFSVDLLDGVPSHPHVVSDVLYRQHGAKPHNVLGQPTRDAGIGGQPIELFELRAATGAVHPAPGDDQDRSRVEDRQVTDSPYRNVVHCVHLLEAAAAAFDAIGTRLQFDLNDWMGLAVLRVDFETADADDSIAFPAAQDCRKFVVGQRWISCLSSLAMG